MNVCIFLTFFFAIFAIFGVLMFSGKQYNLCRQTETYETDPITGEVYWDYYEMLCTTDQSCADRLPEGALAKCGNVYLESNGTLSPVDVDRTEDLEFINYDIVNFNHFGMAGLLIF